MRNINYEKKQHIRGRKRKKEKKRMKAVEIKWDVDNEEDLKFLPTEIDIPDGMNDEDEISDYLSDFSGFCHKGFKLDHEK